VGRKVFPGVRFGSRADRDGLSSPLNPRRGANGQKPTKATTAGHPVERFSPTVQVSWLRQKPVRTESPREVMDAYGLPIPYPGET
jgi:hypothetical protein